MAEYFSIFSTDKLPYSNTFLNVVIGLGHNRLRSYLPFDVYGRVTTHA
jgi:hypothetical protein